MLVHSVFFYLKPGLSAADREQLRRGLESLRTIKFAEQVYIGSPAPTPKRGAVDDAYGFALTILFRDVAAHDAYQIDPVHKAFVEKCSQYWTRVQVYDAQ